MEFTEFLRAFFPFQLSASLNLREGLSLSDITPLEFGNHITCT